MNNIRTFILCSSLLLVVWLTASYSTRLDQAGSSIKPTISSQTNTQETPAPDSSQQNLQNNDRQETVSTSFAKFE